MRRYILKQCFYFQSPQSPLSPQSPEEEEAEEDDGPMFQHIALDSSPKVRRAASSSSPKTRHVALASSPKARRVGVNDYQKSAGVDTETSSNMLLPEVAAKTLALKVITHFLIIFSVV